MTDNPCGHDKRFGLMDLPKEANGCLACYAEQVTARLASAMEALKYNNIHLNETWCWCEPTVESHTD